MNNSEKKPWKLFGVLNVIDLLIIAILIAAAALLGARFLGQRGTSTSAASGNNMTVVTFYGFDDVSDFLPDAIEMGDDVTLYPNDIWIGKIVDMSYEPAYQLVTDPATGETVQEPLLGKLFLTITCECPSALTRSGMTVGDTTFVVGGNYYLNVGPTRAGYRLEKMESAS